MLGDCKYCERSVDLRISFNCRLVSGWRWFGHGVTQQHSRAQEQEEVENKHETPELCYHGLTYQVGSVQCEVEWPKNCGPFSVGFSAHSWLAVGRFVISSRLWVA